MTKRVALTAVTGSAALVIAVAVWRITAGPAQERMPAVAAAQRENAAKLEIAETTQEATS